MEELLKRLQQEELDRLYSKRDKLEETYKNLPSSIQRVEQLTGIEANELITICKIVSWPYEDLEWYNILAIVRAFYNTKNDRSKQ